MAIKIVVFAVLGIIISGLIFSNKSQKKNELVVPQEAAQLPQTSEVRSLEGTLKLLMIKKDNENGNTLHSFLVSDESGKTTSIFEKTVGRGEIMSLHHNSWSPNNKYVIIEDKRGSLTDYLVFKTNGEPFTNGQKYLNATALFNEKVKNYNLKAITGWDDPVLMSVLTVKGPKFWFDVTTQSFIQLAR